jgi:NodT family efflux transporter outer membrane factor (OMF) lipoprotein
MRKRRKRSPRAPRWTWGLCLGAAAAAALALSGCTTSLPEWVHNGFKVGPNYHRPPVPLSDHWIDQNDPRVRVGHPDLAAWWDVFGDPILSDLVRTSYANNLTVRAAAFSILEARAQRAIAIGELLPQSQSYVLQYIRSEVSRNGGSAGGAGAIAGAALAPAAAVAPVTTPSTPTAGATATTGATSAPATTAGASGTATASTSAPTTGVAQTTTTTPTSATVASGVGGAGGGGGGGPATSTRANRFFSNISTSLNMSWELDFWGLFRRNLEASTASLDQSVDNYDELVVLLLANVATQYVEIRTLQKRLQLARQNVALQEPLVNFYYQRYRKGIANAFPGYFQLKSNLDNTRALIPVLEISLRQANNLLCTLLGIPVQDLLPKLGDGTIPDRNDPAKRVVRIPRPVDYSVVVGIPGELLLRRPDVKAAEDQLRIQSAQIGIAEAEMYPHIGINGSIGLAANSLARLFNENSWTGSIGPSLTWNILNYGRLLANVRLQDFKYQEFVATYQNTLLNANLDAENALVAYLKTIEQSGDLQQSADAAVKLTGYLVNQFKIGYLPPGATDTGAFINQLFTATNFQVTQQDAAAQAEGNIALNLILLYRAMGGGWQIRLRDPNNKFFCPGPDDNNLPETLPAPAPEPLPARKDPSAEVLPPPRQLPTPGPMLDAAPPKGP